MAILVQSNKKPSVSFPSQTGSIVTFNSQYAGLPLKSHKIALTATQSGSGTPSLDNVRPINGYSAINVYHPDNLIDFSTCIQGYLYVDGGLVRPTSAMEWTTDNIVVIPNSRIVWWADIVTFERQWVAFCFYDSNGDFISRNSQYFDSQIYTKTVTIPSNATSIRVSWRNYSNEDFTNCFLFTEEQGLKTIPIGSTVYFGEYDARTGLLLVTHEIATYDSNNMPYMQIGTISGGVKTHVFIRQSGVSQDISGVPDMLCNIAEPVEVNAQYTGDEGISIRVNANVNNQGFYIYNEDIQTLAEWQDYINNNSISVVYPLATPQTIQLPPCPIDTLQGVNNIWADTGETIVEYIKIGG